MLSNEESQDQDPTPNKEFERTIGSVHAESRNLLDANIKLS